MPRASQVNPKKWKNIKVLFDNGKYSVITGEFEGRSCLGERWNGDDTGLGFPNSAGYSVWYVAPEFLEAALLDGCRQELLRHPNDASDLSQIEHELQSRRQ